jgi:hypothetical protein
MLAMIEEIRVRVIREVKKDAARETRAVLNQTREVLRIPATNQEARDRRTRDNPAVTRADRVDRDNKDRDKIKKLVIRVDRKE